MGWYSSQCMPRCEEVQELLSPEELQRARDKARELEQGMNCPGRALQQAFPPSHERTATACAHCCMMLATFPPSQIAARSSTSCICRQALPAPLCKSTL